MTYQPLHHKYRPQTFAQLAGQDAIAQTLSNALEKNKIAPAYLFCGPRGTGKTSSARILAKSLNCLRSESPTPSPCGECEACLSITNGSALDVVEIDAASNTGVDNIREIIERVQFSPVQCRYKVYVIDECHMLSTAAFNALLKTLEEPPNRVVFILATTDPQRVLPTIISRCQRFDYRRIPLEAMVKHLGYIANEENIDIEPSALSLIAQLSNGGMRDAESLLDQLSLLSGTITTDKVWNLVGAVSEQDLLDLLSAIATNHPETVIIQCRKLLDRGREPLIVLQNLANFYLSLLIAKTAPQKSELVTLTQETWQKLCQTAENWTMEVILQGQKKLKDSEVQIKNTTQPRLWLEITLLNLLPCANLSPVISSTTPKIDPSPETKTSQNSHNESITSPSQPPDILPPTPEISENKDHITHNPSPETNNFTSLKDLKEKVANVITSIMTKSFLLQQCEILDFQNNTVTIGVISEFFLKFSKKHQPEIQKGFNLFCNSNINLVFQIEGERKDSPKKESLSPSPEIVTHNPVIQNSPPPSSPIKSPPSEKNTKSPEKSSTKAQSSQPLKQIAENFAKSVNGEIVLTELKPINADKPPKILNRPSLEIDDEDDLPF